MMSLSDVQDFFNNFRMASPKQVKELHTNDDLDAGALAHHHTLGLRSHQAAPGYLLAEAFGRLDAADATIANEATIRATEDNLLDVRLDGLESKPSVVLTQTVVQSCVTTADVIIDWDTVYQALQGTGLTVDLTNNRIVVNRAGRYRIRAEVAFAFNATGYRRARILINGTSIRTWPMDANTVNNLPTVPVVEATVDLAVNDIITIAGLQTTGANLNTSVGATYQSFFEVEMIRG